ncbi:MAG: DUF1616 domain-containing protein [Thermoplasmata archaeon]|nr:DUF1616 domain-containing protein [Thermoplasmata archaeon]
MRIHFREKPHDLLVILISSILLVIAVALAASGPLRIALGLLFILFLPGYALIAALFPSGKEIDWIERVALSFGLSIAVVPLLGLLLNYTWGIFEPTTVAAIFIFILLMCGAAYYRRMRLPVDERLALTVDLAIPDWEEYSTLDKVLTIALVISIITAVSVLVYALTVPRVGERFTEFYILDESGMAEDYPTSLNATENATVIIGVANHEFANVSYTVRKDLVTIQWVYNTSAERDEPVEISRVTLHEEIVILDHEDMWEASLNFSIADVGDYKLEFLLYKDGDMSEAYNSLHLWIDVH